MGGRTSVYKGTMTNYNSILNGLDSDVSAKSSMIQDAVGGIDVDFNTLDQSEDYDGFDDSDESDESYAEFIEVDEKG
jgi:hypothetical protein